MLNSCKRPVKTDISRVKTELCRLCIAPFIRNRYLWGINFLLKCYGQDYPSIVSIVSISAFVAITFDTTAPIRPTMQRIRATVVRFPLRCLIANTSPMMPQTNVAFTYQPHFVLIFYNTLRDRQRETALQLR